MPIWTELLILMLVAYVVGLGIGWALWGRDPSGPADGTDIRNGGENENG